MVAIDKKLDPLFKNGFLYLLPIALLAAVMPLQNQRLNNLKDKTVISPVNLERQVQAKVSTLAVVERLPTLGFDNLVANWFYLQFLQYFGDDEARRVTGYSLSPKFFRIVIPNDPFYRMYYLFLSGSGSNFAGKPDETIGIINQGLAQLTPNFPDDGFYIWRYRGVDELLYLGDGVAAQKSFQTAADWSRQSSHPDAEFMTENSQGMANFLADNPDSKQAQVGAWSSVLANAFDDGTRQRAIDRIRDLGGDAIIENGVVRIQFPQDD